MATFNSTHLQTSFEQILSIESFSDYITDILELIYKGKLDQSSLSEVMNEYGINNTEEIKGELIDIIIVYVNLVLNDNIITEEEQRNVEWLKRNLRISEGDFTKYRSDEIEEILKRQFYRLYLDNYIDESEEIYEVQLQQLFNLSYDQFNKLKNKEIRRALDEGADIIQLSTVLYPELNNQGSVLNSRTISQTVKDQVWNRDNGKCTSCGATENIEFDHIVPFSKGGSNTYRNIQLLCENCNRIKSNKIG